MRCRCHPSNLCGRCDEADWWVQFGLLWWCLGGAVNGVPIRIVDDHPDAA